MDSASRDDASAASGVDVVPSLRAAFERRTLPRHLALFYQSAREQLTAAATYVSYGLQNDRRCLYLVDDNTRARVESAFETAGIDVEGRIAAGDLQLRDAGEMYLDADFEPQRMIDELEAACLESVEAGYDGLLVAGENTWSFHTETDFDHVLDFEIDFDAHCPELPVTALCQYDLTRFNEESIAKAVWTHEYVVYRNTLCENPYYLSPSQYRSDGNQRLNAQLMLEQTYDLARAQREIERREQRLGVVNRVLRHNVRNDMNVARGNLERLLDAEPLSAEAESWVRTAIDHLDSVIETADKARYVQASLGAGTVRRVRLARPVEEAIAEAHESHPDAEIEVEGAVDTVVFADTNLGAAMAELLQNAIVHQRTDRPRVTVRASVPDVGTVHVDIDNPGPPIPESDRRALREGAETPLEHASGLGLWFVKWIVENGEGRLRFPDDGEPQIRVELPRSQ